MRAGLSLVLVALSAVACASAAPVPEAQTVPVASPLAVVGAAPTAAAAAPPARNAVDAPGAFAIFDEESHRIILDDEVKDEVLASSPFETSSAGAAVHVLEAKVKLAELSPEMRLEGRSFALYRGAERKCVVRAGPIRAVGYTYDPVSYDEPAEGAAPEKPSTEEVARALWTSSNTYLATKVTVGPDCKGATWARLEELPEPRFATLRAPAEPLASQAVATFQKRPGWVEAQTRFVEIGGGGAAAAKSGTWEDVGSVTLNEVVAPFAGGTFLLRQAVWEEGCGANAGLTMVWRNDNPNGAVAYEADDRFIVDVVMDLDGDGTLEMFGTEGDGPSFRPFFGTEKAPSRDGAFLTHAVAIHGCRC